MKYAVTVRRTELITFSVEATSKEDAEARYLMDGEEEMSRTKESTVVDVEADEDPYAHLDDPAEREWLTKVSPLDVLRNAHRIYDFMREAGLSTESVVRELAFEKAADKLSISYDVLYEAWVNETPVAGDVVAAAESSEG